ncbi:hypothetical protein JCM10213_002580 [Rhodosporidiobolus nylandii]
MAPDPSAAQADPPPSAAATSTSPQLQPAQDAPQPDAQMNDGVQHASAVSSELPTQNEMGRSQAPSPSPAAEHTSGEGAVGEAGAAQGSEEGLLQSPAQAEAAEEPSQTQSSSPSTPTRSSSSARPVAVEQAHASPSASSSSAAAQGAPHSSSPAAAGATPSSSPSSAGRCGSSSPSPSSSPANHPPSRRVKVYKLHDDAWQDLGTGTCAGVFLQAGGGEDEDGQSARRVREEDEGAWIVVRREKAGRDDGSGSPTKGKGKGGDAEGKMLGEAEEGERGVSSSSKPQGDAAPSSDDDDLTSPSIILKSRVQPYPPGYSPDDALLSEEDEITSLDDAGNATIDAGGYQRQQDTLIVWTERGGDDEDEVEMALSFATPSGCSEMWEFIKAARRFAAEQQALRSPSPSPSLSSSDRAFPLHSSHFSSLSTLPEPTLGNLSVLEGALRTIGRTAVGRERAANMIVRSGFVEKLCRVHEEAEDLESIEDLHALCRVMQTILLLNDSALFELVIRDELILGVVGMLEYDPDFPTMKASYRAHLSSPTSFVPVLDPSRLPSTLLTKIHHTHRLHYLKDVVLARILEDSTFSMLNSHIYFNEVDIVNEVAGERELLREVFRILEEGEPENAAAGASRGREQGPGGAAGKGKERELGPKRTIGPELPDDLLAARKKPRLSASSASEAGPSSPPPTASATIPESAPPSSAGEPTPTSATFPSTSEPLIPPPQPYERKLHATLFLAQLSGMAKNLQLPIRTNFYKTLCDRGLLSALEGALRFSDRLSMSSATGEEGEVEEERERRAKRHEDANTMRAAALALWMNVVDLDAADVRGYCLRQGKDVDAAAEEAGHEADKEGGEGGEGGAPKTMLGVLIEMFKKEEDLGVKTQLAEALRVLVDVAGEGGPLEAPPRVRQEDPEAEKFLQYFYDHCMLSLVAPLMELPERKENDPPLDLAPHQIALLSQTCDLLCFFISHHTFRSKYLVLSNPQLAKSVVRILRPRPRLVRHTPLRLAALRFIRSIVARTDDFYNRFLIKHDLIRPVLETADEEKERDNLLGSACLEFFEYLRTTNAKALLNHVMDRAGEQVRKLATVVPPLKTFESLIARWEMNNEPPPVPTVTVSAPGGEGASSSGAGATSTSMQRQRSQPAGWNARMEIEEESYFNGSDDEDEEDKPAAIGETAPTAASLLAGGSFGSSRRKREREPTNMPTSASASSLSSASNGQGDPKRPKLDDGADAMPRSKTWPGTGKGGLVDYLGDGDSDEEKDEPEGGVKAEPEDPSIAGGFIRERRGAVDEGDGTKMEVDPATLPPSANGEAAPKEEEKDAPVAPSSAPPPLLSLGELKRKKEEEEDGELGLLAKKKAVSPSSSSSSSAAPSKPVSTAPAAPKPGGFKIAFGGLKSKFGAFGGGKAKEGGEKGS